MNSKIVGSILALGLTAWAAAPLNLPLNESLLIDNFADEDLNSALGPWESYADAGGLTTLNQTFSSNAGVNGTSKAFKMDFSLDGYSILGYDPFVEAKVYMVDREESMDMSSCNEITYEYRGTEDHFFKVMSSIDVQNNYHRKKFPSSGKWVTAHVHWDDLIQYEIDYWGLKASISDVKLTLLAFSWQVEESDGTVGTLEITNIRCAHKPTYEVSFYLEDSLLQTKDFVEGEMPFYDGDTWIQTEGYELYIEGWKPNIVPVSANASYVAVADSSVRHFEVSFNDEYDNRLYSTTLPYGATPQYMGLEPFKFPSEEYTYTFKGWGVEICGKKCTIEYLPTLPPVTSDVYYYPVFDSARIEYTVKFVDHDGRTISSQKYYYGTEAEDIVLPANPEWSGHTFEGWIPEISWVTGNTAYVASYSSEGNDKYTVTFLDGSEVLQIIEVDAGETPVYTGETPAREPTVTNIWTFNDWRDQNGYGIDEIYENTVYMADFYEYVRHYNIVFHDDDGSVMATVDHYYSQNVSTDEVTTKADTSDDYQVARWEPEFERVTGDAEYQVVYNYRVRYVDDEGNEVCWANYYAAGEIPDSYCTPQKSSTAEFTYEFAGWDKEFTAVTGPTTYTALFIATPVPPAASIEIASGESWLVDDFDDGNETSKLGTGWFVFDDKDAYGLSEISKEIVAKDDGNAMKVKYTVDRWAGLGIDLSADGHPVDLSQCNAIRYDYKGGHHTFEIGSAFDEDYDYRIKSYARTSREWTTATHYIKGFYGGSVEPSLSITRATQFIWDDFDYDDEDSLEVDNIRCLNLPTYAVKFYNGEELLYSETVVEGDETWYRGDVDLYELARDMSNNQYVYNFVGWDLEYAPIMAETNYHAVFDTSLKTYTISFYTHQEDSYWQSWDYWSMHYQDVPYGSTPVYDGPEPTRESDYTCNGYVFDKWTLDPDEESVYGLQPVTKSVTYYPLFTCEDPVVYTVTFKDDEGNVISSKEYQYWDELEVVDDPIKESTAEYECRFEGWDSYLEYHVIGNATYVAEFDCSVRDYTVKFVNPDGEILDQRDYPYGTLYADIFDQIWDPSMYSVGVEYTFTGWLPDSNSSGNSVTGPVTFTAQYSKRFAVRFVDYDGSGFYVNDMYQEILYPEGTPLSEIATPNMKNWIRSPGYDSLGTEYEYTFVGWLPALDSSATLTEPMTFVATYTSSLRTHMVVFKNGSEILEQKEVAEGVVPEYTGWIEPFKDSDDQYNYTWNRNDGWDKPLVAVNGPVIYTAKFTPTLAKYEVVFVGDDGTELLRKFYDYGSAVTDVPTEAQILGGRTGEYRFNGWRNVWWDECNLDFVSEDMECYADMEYKVRFYDADDNLIDVNPYDDDWYRYGETVAYCDDHYYDCYTPVKEMTVANIFTWNGEWSPSFDSYVTGPVDYRPVFDVTLRKYNVSFVDENGIVLKAAVAYDYGTEASAIETPETYPMKNPTVTQVYSFNGWNLADVTGDTVYVATYTSSPRPYTVSFVDQDGFTIIQSRDYVYGTPASAIEVPTPEKNGFRFVGWEPEISNVTGDAAYRARYVNANEFVVTWRDDDGTLLDQQVYTGNVPPEYPDGTPSKAPTAEIEYVFNGWTSSVVDFPADVEFTATYTEQTRHYLVTFVDGNGNVLDQQDYVYGTPAASIVVPDAPEKASTEFYLYTFVGWTPSITNVTGDATYRALFANKRRTYTITFKEGNGRVWQEWDAFYDSELDVSYGPDKYTDGCIYGFDHWETESTPANIVKGDMEFTAVYSSECNVRKYEVEFYDSLRDRWLGFAYYDYGTPVDDIQVPGIADMEVDGCNHHFVGWEPELSEVKKNVEYRTVYELQCGEPESSSSVVVSSSSVVPPSSSSVVPSSSSVVPPSSSSVVPSSSSVKPSSSSSVKPSSSSTKSRSSSSVKPSSSSAKSRSSSSVKPSSSSTKSRSSSSVKASSSSAKSRSSSSSPKTSSSGKNAIIAVSGVPSSLRIGFTDNVLTVALASPSMVRVQVFDMTGQLIEKMDEYVSGSHVFDFGRLTQGNYVVRVSSRSVHKSVRIVVR
ncbi:InlB B-repeat-containing protein [uncultured Fibrobacter sp.]|uniref:InlB B-repeat-containing protein n=1 Tax=uncultured Fibrobacter sp. TaxID=261512 RepID=UPI00262BE1D3|nr:InlB B-repeat-containing protein [uncultured Fibrobacter sp.]